jgi:hypothetical protein
MTRKQKLNTKSKSLNNLISMFLIFCFCQTLELYKYIKTNINIREIYKYILKTIN